MDVIFHVMGVGNEYVHFLGIRGRFYYLCREMLVNVVMMLY